MGMAGEVSVIHSSLLFCRDAPARWYYCTILFSAEVNNVFFWEWELVASCTDSRKRTPYNFLGIM